MAILAIAASKGGSGKTTLCLLLADAFARVGMPVAILDADPRRPLCSGCDGARRPATSRR